MTAPTLLEQIARAIREGRQCGTRDAPLTVPCPFCHWGPDDLTPEWCETGCIWLAEAVLPIFRAAAVKEAEDYRMQADQDATEHKSVNYLAGQSAAIDAIIARLNKLGEP